MPYINIGRGIGNGLLKKRLDPALPPKETALNKKTSTFTADNTKIKSERKENTVGSKKRRLEDDDQEKPAKRVRLEDETRTVNEIEKLPRFNKRTPVLLKSQDTRTGLHGAIATIEPAQGTHAGPQGVKCQTKGIRNKKGTKPEGKRGRKGPATPTASRVSKPRVPRCKQRILEFRRSSGVHRTSEEASILSTHSAECKNNVPEEKKWELYEDQYLINAAWRNEDWSSIAAKINTGTITRSEQACQERVRQLLGELRGQSKPVRDLPDEDLLWALRQDTRSSQEIADEDFMRLVIRQSHLSDKEPTKIKKYPGIGKEPNKTPEVGPRLLKLAAAVFTNRLRNQRPG